MNKSLSEMSLEELWQLFPIIVKPHNPEYSVWFAEEQTILKQAVGTENIVRINHIGSTAVPGLLAKPTVDILLEIKSDCSLETLKNSLLAQDYQFSPQPKNPPPHMMFNKGYTIHGFAAKVFHLHVRYPGDWNELYFRDYLKLHQDIAAAYGELKLSLLAQFKHNRDGYTAAKTDFIQKHTALARRQFPDRYVV